MSSLGVSIPTFPHTILMGNGTVPSNLKSKTIVVSKQFESYIYVYVFDGTRPMDIYENVVMVQDKPNFNYETDAFGLVEKRLRMDMTITGEIPVILAGKCRMEERLETQLLKLDDYLRLIVESEKKYPSQKIRRI